MFVEKLMKYNVHFVGSKTLSIRLMYLSPLSQTKQGHLDLSYQFIIISIVDFCACSVASLLLKWTWEMRIYLSSRTVTWGATGDDRQRQSTSLTQYDSICARFVLYLLAWCKISTTCLFHHNTFLPWRNTKPEVDDRGWIKIGSSDDVHPGASTCYYRLACWFHNTILSHPCQSPWKCSKPWWQWSKGWYRWFENRTLITDNNGRFIVNVSDLGSSTATQTTVRYPIPFRLSGDIPRIYSTLTWIMTSDCVGECVVDQWRGWRSCTGSQTSTAEDGSRVVRGGYAGGDRARCLDCAWVDFYSCFHNNAKSHHVVRSALCKAADIAIWVFRLLG